MTFVNKLVRIYAVRADKLINPLYIVASFFLSVMSVCRLVIQVKGVYKCNRASSPLYVLSVQFFCLVHFYVFSLVHETLTTHAHNFLPL